MLIQGGKYLKIKATTLIWLESEYLIAFKTKPWHLICL